MVRRLSSLLRFGILVIPLVGAPPGFAQDPPKGSVQERPATLGTVLVSPRRIPGVFLNADRFPGNATVITAEELRAWNASTVQEALARVEGVTVADTGGFGVGSDASVNLRGVSNGSRTNALVLVNGVRQNRLTGDEVHWQAIPVNQVDRIEIIRGGSGTIYGEGALAGVINIYTKQQSERRLETEEGVEIGSFGWQKYSMAARGSTAPAHYGVSYTRRLLGGYREFSSSRNTTVTAHAGVDLTPRARVNVNVLHSEDTSQYPGGLTLAQTEQRRIQAVQSRVTIFDDQIDQVSMDLSAEPSEGLTCLVNAFWRDWTTDSRRSGLFTLTPSRGLSLRSSHEWVGHLASNVMISGVELNDDKASTGTRGGVRTDESNRHGYGLYLEDTLTFWDRLTLSAGFRYDRARFEEDIVAFDSLFNEVNYVGTLLFEGKSPKVGVAVDLIPSHLTLFSNYSRPFKAPNVDDFASRSPDFKGNIALKPQQGNAYELGARSQAGPWQTNATAFFSKIDEEILFVQGIPGNAFVFQNQNHDTRRLGVETAVRLSLPERGLRGAWTYTFVDAEFRKGAFAGNTLPGTPAHVMTLGAGVSPLPSLWLDLDWQLINDSFRINDVANVLPADNYNVLNLTLQYDIPRPVAGPQGPEAKAFLKLLNLTGAEYSAFQSSNGHTLTTGAGENPAPPFHVIGGVSVRF